MSEDTNPPRRARGRPRIPLEEKKRHNITFRIRTELRDAIEERASSEGRSISEEIENIIEKHVTMSIYGQLERSNIRTKSEDMANDLSKSAAEADIYKRIDKISSLVIDDLILFRMANLIVHDSEMMSEIKKAVYSLQKCSEISRGRWMSRMEDIVETIANSRSENKDN